MRSKNLWVLVSVFAMTASGCGFAPTTVTKSSKSNSNSSFILDTRNIPTEFTCPGSTNVSPHYDSAFNGSGYYEVCTSKSSIYGMFAVGNAAQGPETTICVFPVEYVNDQNIYVKPDVANSGLPWYKCNSLASNNHGAAFSFDSTTYNAAFIVEQKDVAQMQQCLIVQNYFACPTNFSYGKFR